MAGANSNIQVTNLDFADIKTNFIKYLQGQSTFQDYNFTGSALSTLIDVLVYNTQYNAFYLNMVANEMFLDTALQRSSVVSHAKLLNYTPKSSTATSAFVDVVATGVSPGSLIMPRFTQFLSEPVGGKSYPFVTVDTLSTTVSSGTATFINVELKQGVPVTLTFAYSSSANPGAVFALPDSTIDTSTLLVEVFTNSTSTSFTTYNQAVNFLGLNGTSPVYFLEEAVSGYYQISFGDGIIGQALSDGNVVVVSYLTTSGTASAGANNFAITSSLGSYTTNVIPVVASAGGTEQESIDSIKYQAPKTYAAQGRAVTIDDYITLIKQNTLGYTFDAVNVWGGEQNDPPAYGQVFISLKPSGAYTFTETQKKIITNSIIKPISVLTVKPTLVDPDYTYVKVITNVVYDQKRTNQTYGQIQNSVIQSIENFGTSTLNTFNSTFSLSQLIETIQFADPSIYTNEVSIQLQKKFYPMLGTSSNYTLYYNTPLQRGLLSSGISSTPGMQFIDPVTPSQIIDGIFIEEVPSSVGGIQNISIINPGFSYQYPPTVTILGDGTGATAAATISQNGKLSAITVTSAGNNYTQAVVSISPASGDTTGTNGAAVATLEGQYGTLRLSYYNANNVKTVFNPNIGTVDYVNGTITLTSFSPYDVDNSLGQLIITANPITTIISSTYNRIITIDPNDPSAVIVNLSLKN